MKIMIEISDDLKIDIERYTKLTKKIYLHGDMTEQQREESRSYAEDITRQLLNSNPEVFNYVSEMESAKKKIYNLQ
jgi:hypothetical protein